MVKKRKKNIYIYKQKNKMLYSKIHKKNKFGGVQQSQKEKKRRRKENHFNLGNHKKTLGVKQKKGNK